MKLSLAPLALTLALTGAARSAHSAPASIESSRTPRGSVVLIERDRTSPRLAISLVLRAGAADETPANAGWRRLLVDAMLQGTRDPDASAGATDGPFLSSAQLRDRVESLGGRLTAQVGDDAIELGIVGPSSRANSLLEILMAVATQPRLSDADIDRARRSLVRLHAGSASPSSGAPELNTPSDPGTPGDPGAVGSPGAVGGVLGELDASALALRRLEERLYRDASGAPVAYALPSTGTLQSLSNLDSAALHALFGQYFAPQRRVLSMAGDVDSAGLRARALELEAGGEWSVAPDASPVFAALPASAPLEVMQSGSPSASVFLSYPVDFGALSAKEAAALQVLAAALGESPRARLPRRLSDARRAFGGQVPEANDPALARVAYAPRLSAQWVPRRYKGEFVLWAQTGPRQIEAVKNALLDEMRKIRDGALSPDELRAAKNFTRGARAADRELLRDRASQNALEAARTIGNSTGKVPITPAAWAAQVESLSAGDVRQAARKYLQLYAVALVMPTD